MTTEAQFRADEMRHLQRKSKALWRRVRAGEDTALLRGRIDRLEALQAALMGFPEFLAE